MTNVLTCRNITLKGAVMSEEALDGELMPPVYKGPPIKTKYGVDTLAMAKAYIDGGYKQTDDPEVVPTIEGLCYWLDITKSTLKKWCADEEKEEFGNLVERLMDLQAKKLVSGGLTGDYVPTMAKVMLSQHGYAETIREERRYTNKEGNDLMAEDLEILRRLGIGADRGVAVRHDESKEKIKDE